MSAAEIRAQQAWFQERGEQLSKQLANNTYPYGKEIGPVPELLFQYDVVQNKLKEMKKNESLNASNRKRITTKENSPYFTQDSMKTNIESLSQTNMEPLPNSMDKRKYEVYLLDSQAKAVFYRTIPPIPFTNEFKIHFMFNIKYITNVLTILFDELIKPNKIPVMFKVLVINHVNAIAGRAGTPNPLIRKSGFENYSYGVNNAQKYKYGRLTETFAYLPVELKRHPVKYQGSDTFTLTGTTRKNKKYDHEIFEFETLFDPIIVFYTIDGDYTAALLDMLLKIFPDERTRDWVLPHFYPRANVKMNNMIYLANGDFGTKDNIRCIRGASGPECILHEPIRLLDLPEEYQKIQDNCSELKAKEQCQAVNRFPMAVSNHKLCKWESEECKPHRVHSQHLLLENYPSLVKLYERIGQSQILKKFIESNENNTFPVNYMGGRRKSKRSKRRTNACNKNTKKR